MKDYSHITEMEKIMDNHNEKIEKLNDLLDYLKDNMGNFEKLLDYYYSDQRYQDLKDDEEGLIDQNLKRGVLSEDAIYDLISEYYECNIKMLEIATRYFKRG